MLRLGVSHNLGLSRRGGAGLPAFVTAFTTDSGIEPTLVLDYENDSYWLGSKTVASQPRFDFGRHKGLTGTGTFDFFVDATNGNDTNDGTSEGAAWASLNKINDISVASDFRVLVKSDTYDKASDQFKIDVSSTSGRNIDVVFEPGCVVDGTNYSSGNALETSGTGGDYSNNVKVYGNGLTVQNVATATGNGLSQNNGGTFNYYDIRTTACADGRSAHGDARINYYNCSADACTKTPLAHVNTSVVNEYGCVADDTANTASGGICDAQASSVNFEDCVFIGTDGEVAKFSTGTTLTRCQVGTLANRVALAGTIDFTATDCFVHLAFALNNIVNMVRCFGKFSARCRDGGSLTMDNCCIIGGSSNNQPPLWSNTDFGDCGPVFWRNTIFTGSYTLMSIDATQAGYLVAANSEFHNNILDNSKVYDQDLIDAGADIQGTITEDPNVGSADTTFMEDYGFTEGTGSSAEDSATDGGNIGFSVSEANNKRDKLYVAEWDADASAGSLAATINPVETPTTETVYLTLSDGTANEKIEVYADASANIKLRVVDGGTTQADIDSGVNAAGDTSFKAAVSWTANDFAISVDGNTAVTDSAGTVPVVTELELNARLPKAIAGYEPSLSDGDLQALTA